MNNLYICIAIAVIMFGGGWKVRDWQAQGDALEASNQALADVKTKLIKQGKLALSDSVTAKTLEEVLSAIKPTIQTVTIRETEYEKEPVYINCVVPRSGVQLLNDRINQRGKSTNARERKGEVFVSPAVAQ